ncbi:MAG: DUF5789 family protein [Halobacteriota archaeon]
MRLYSTDDLLTGHEYPATTTELITAYGDSRIELQNGSETLGEVLSRLGEETYYGPNDARTAVISALSHKAIGRRFYSDRDQYALGENGPDPVSF